MSINKYYHSNFHELIVTSNQDENGITFDRKQFDEKTFERIPKGDLNDSHYNESAFPM